jgi:putative membrane protein
MSSTGDREKFDVRDPRVVLAAERTLLAWVRTGLALMGFGFVVARFGLFLREMQAINTSEPAPAHGGLSQWIGVALILLGVAVHLAAAADHARFLVRVRRGEPYLLSRWPLGIIVAAILAVLGAGLAAYLFVTSR